MKKFIAALLLAPFLLFPAASARANVYGATEIGDYYHLVYPVVEGEDPHITEIINTDLYTMVSEVGSKGVKERIATFHFQLMSETDRYLSFLLMPGYYNEGAAHGMYYAHGIVYDKVTGERVPLSHFARVSLEDLLRLQEQEEFYSVHTIDRYPLDRREILGRPQEVPANYFIAEDGRIFVLFQPSELTSYAAGATCINVTSLKR